MIIILFGALCAGTKTYSLCRSDRDAFMSAFCNTLPVGCLKFCFSLEIRSSICPFTIPSKMIELKALPLPIWPNAIHTGQQLHIKVINFYPSHLCMALSIYNLKLKYEDVDNRKTNHVNTIVFNLHQINRGTF